MPTDEEGHKCPIKGARSHDSYEGVHTQEKETKTAFQLQGKAVTAPGTMWQWWGERGCV